IAGTLQFNHTGPVTFAPPISGAGLVLHNNSGSSTIANAAGFTGSFFVNSGTLILKNTLGPAAYSSSGTLRFDTATVNLGTSAIRSNNGGGAIEYKNSVINGGFLRGGIHTALAGGVNTFNGVTTFNGTTIVQNGDASFNNV